MNTSERGDSARLMKHQWTDNLEVMHAEEHEEEPEKEKPRPDRFDKIYQIHVDALGEACKNNGIFVDVSENIFWHVLEFFQCDGQSFAVLLDRSLVQSLVARRFYTYACPNSMNLSNCLTTCWQTFGGSFSAVPNPTFATK